MNLHELRLEALKLAVQSAHVGDPVSEIIDNAAAMEAFMLKEELARQEEAKKRRPASLGPEVF